MSRARAGATAIILLLAGVFLGGLSGCSSAGGERAASTALDPADSVEVVLTRWYEAIAVHDSAGIAAPLAEDFLLVEDTTLVRREPLVRGLMAGAGQGTQRTALRDFHTVVTQEVAWTTFRNHEDWIPTNGRAPMGFDFIETVVFRRHDGRWLMERYHATPVRPGP